MKIEKNPKRYDEITKRVMENDGYCPCIIAKNEDTKCPCKEFRESDVLGECRCGRYIKTDINTES